MTTTVLRKRGRPRKDERTVENVRNAIITSGIVAFTENNFHAAGLDGILRQAGVPKGSFYDYFESKDAFGLTVLDSYCQYFQHKLNKTLLNTSLSPLERINAFCENCCASMAKHQFNRGCIAGNMSLEVGMLPEVFRARLMQIFQDWQRIMYSCLEDACDLGEINNVDCKLWADQFWIGWEGAVMRAKLLKNETPLRNYVKCFVDAIKA